jgi:hypothetical protein
MTTNTLRQTGPVATTNATNVAFQQTYEVNKSWIVLLFTATSTIIFAGVIILALGFSTEGLICWEISPR